MDNIPDSPALPLRAVAARVANLLVRYAWRLWFWGDSIGIEGLLDAAELTGQHEYASFAHGLIKGWLGRENHRSKFDYTAPGVALLRLYEETADPALLAAAYRHAGYMHAFRKTEAGAYVRYEDAAVERPPELPADHPDSPAWRDRAASADGGPCVLVDSMHFDGPFFAKLYQVTREDRFRQEALANILPQIALLFDPGEKLFHHFWIERTRSPNGVLWGRGNGWALLGIVGTAEFLPPSDPGAASLLRTLTALAHRLRDLQDETGGWHTVLNDPDSYLETSIAAFVVDGFARSIEYGWLDRREFMPVVEKAIRYLVPHIASNGQLEGVSYETFPSTRAEHYRQMPRNAVVPWGQGPLLSALLSYSRLMCLVPE